MCIRDRYSEENPEGYRDNGERAERMYELKTDWSEYINRAISVSYTHLDVYKRQV